MPDARVSVVMAVKDARPFIEESVRSILGQTFPDFEFLIVDDGSTDGTLDCLQSFVDGRVRVLRNEGAGQTAALNLALRNAKAPWIARMDGDDWSDPRRLEKQTAAAAKDPEAVLVSADYWICDETLEPVAPIRLAGRNDKMRAYLKARNNPLCHPLMMFRRDAALAAGGFDESLKNAQDYDLWLKLLDKGNWVHVPELLFKYRVVRSSLSILRQPEQTRERARITGKGPAAPDADGAFRTRRAVDGMYAYRLGFSAWLAGRRWTSWRHLFRALRLGARPLRCVAALGLSLLPRRLYLKLSGYEGVYL